MKCLMEFEHYKHETLKCIYEITLNGKKYIGQTNDTNTRFKAHQKEDSGCRYIRNAIQEHGWENAKVKILLVDLTLEEANRLETHYIDTLGTLAPGGYNLTRGGDCGEVSEETKKLHRERWKDPEYKEKHSSMMKEFWKDPEYKEKYSSMMKERWEDPYFKNKMKELRETPDYKESHRQGQKNRYSSETNKEKHRDAMEHLRRFTDDEFITTHEKCRGSVKMMMNILNVGHTAINEHKQRLGLTRPYTRKICV